MARSLASTPNQQTGCEIPAGIPGTGGEIAFGEGAVWATAIQIPITRIDPASNAVVQQWFGTGGDSIRIGHGSIWLTDLLSWQSLDDSIRSSHEAEGLQRAIFCSPCRVFLFVFLARRWLELTRQHIFDRHAHFGRIGQNMWLEPGYELCPTGRPRISYSSSEHRHPSLIFCPRSKSCKGPFDLFPGPRLAQILGSARCMSLT